MLWKKYVRVTCSGNKFRKKEEYGISGNPFLVKVQIVGK